MPVLDRICRESYNDPHEVYETLKRRGMDLVTVTDHDSIDSVESLRCHADFFLSEEVTCSTPNGTHLHMGVYGIEDRHHIELQRRRDDLPRLISYLNEQRLLFSINHVYSSLTGPRTDADFEEFAASFPAVETLNGQMLAVANRLAEAFASRSDKAAVGGSDAHTLACLGRTFTEVPGARSTSEYLAGLKQGRGAVYGESGDYWKLTSAVWSIASSMILEKPWTVVLAPLMAVVPVVTLVNFVMEVSFAAKWGERTARVARPVATPAAVA